MSMRHLLAERDGLRVVHEYEDAFLECADGEISLGDHYGDPTCALIGPDRSWCVVGGEGISVLHLNASKSGPRSELWRRDLPPPDNAPCWFVSDLRHMGGDLVQAVIDPSSSAGGVYEVDVRTLEWRKL